MNIASLLRDVARRSKDRLAIHSPDGNEPSGKTRFRSWTFGEIEELSDAYARGFQARGIGRGTKTIIMLKAGPELFIVVFALFKVGSIPVIVDPGMGPARMLHCYETVGAEAFIGIPLAHVIRVLRRKSFSSVKTIVTVGRGPFPWGGPTLDSLAMRDARAFELVELPPDAPAVINFTTGSTGPARGVEYTPAGVVAMVETLKQLYADIDGAVTFVTLPLFALFDMLLGIPAVLAPMDPTKPALVSAPLILDAIERHGCTHMFASPAFLHRVGPYAEAHGQRISSLRCIVSGGAPIMPQVIEQFRRVVSPDARILATYGATEALPMASIEGRELEAETSQATREGRGTCAGYISPGLSVRIIRIVDGPITRMTDDCLASPYEVGEIAVQGAIVSPRYHEDPQNNALAKIQDATGQWHRTGDLGTRDEKGRLWFAGRKSDRVETADGPRFTVQCEGILNGHPAVYRTALVGVGQKGSERQVVCVELRDRHSKESLARIEQELRELAKRFRITSGIDTFLFHPGFPVDIRHNAKIGRDALAAWAADRVLATDGRPAPRRTAPRPSWPKAIPIAGWLYIALGVVFPFANRWLYGAWLIDVALSVGVHSLQLFRSIPIGRRAGYSLSAIVLNTLAFGATFWKFIEPRELLGRNRLPTANGAA